VLTKKMRGYFRSVREYFVWASRPSKEDQNKASSTLSYLFQQKERDKAEVALQEVAQGHVALDYD